jgi:hypothetical protein
VHSIEHDDSSLQSHESVESVARSGDAEAKSSSFLHSAAALFPALHSELQGRMEMTRMKKTGVESDDCTASPRQGVPKLQRATDNLLGGFSLMDYQNIKRYILKSSNGMTVKFSQHLHPSPMTSKMKIM